MPYFKKNQIIVDEQGNPVSGQERQSALIEFNNDINKVPEFTTPIVTSPPVPTAPIKEPVQQQQPVQQGQPYSGSSVVDYLRSTGQASDFTTRSGLAAKVGIQGYVGSAAQNLQLLDTLRKQSTSPTIQPAQPPQPVQIAQQPTQQPMQQPEVAPTVEQPTQQSEQKTETSRIESDITKLFEELNGTNVLGQPKSITDVVSEISTQMGLPQVNEEIKTLDNNFIEESTEINNDPWITEGNRQRQISRLKSKYDEKKNALIDRLRLQESVVGKAVDYYYKQQEYKKEILMKQIDTKMKEMEQSKVDELDIAKLQSTLEQGQSFEVDGQTYQGLKSDNPDYLSFQDDQGNVTLIDKKTKAVTTIEGVGKAKEATGIVGEYNFYAQQEKNAGKTPMSFNDYQTMDANRKKSIARAGVPGQPVVAGDVNPQLYTGLTTQTAQAVRSKVSSFKSEPVVTNFNVVNEGYNFVKSIPSDTKNPADDIGFIYAFAKIMDPNSVVREGEYATVQKYAQSWSQSFGFDVARLFSNEKFLTTEAINNMKKTLDSKYNASKTNYNNVYNQYSKNIDNLTGRNDGKKFLVDYGSAFSENSSTEPAQADNDYIKSLNLKK